jgi:hypothetical protein
VVLQELLDLHIPRQWFLPLPGSGEVLLRCLLDHDDFLLSHGEKAVSFRRAYETDVAEVDEAPDLVE